MLHLVITYCCCISLLRASWHYCHHRCWYQNRRLSVMSSPITLQNLQDSGSHPYTDRSLMLKMSGRELKARKTAKTNRRLTMQQTQAAANKCIYYFFSVPVSSESKNHGMLHQWISFINYHISTFLCNEILPFNISGYYLRIFLKLQKGDGFWLSWKKISSCSDFPCYLGAGLQCRSKL